MARASPSDDRVRDRRTASRVSSTASGLRVSIRSAVSRASATPDSRSAVTMAAAVGAAKHESIQSLRPASTPGGGAVAPSRTSESNVAASGASRTAPMVSGVT